MNKQICLIILLLTLFGKLVTAQIICIYCYDQNDSISDNVNNLILNGGFENSTCVPGSQDSWCPNSQFYTCDILNWTCTGGGNNTYSSIFDTTYNKSFIAEGIKSAYFGNAVCQACSNISNDTSCIGQILCIATNPPSGYPNHSSNYGGANGVNLEQTVNGLVIGNTYVLEFWAGGEFYAGSFYHEGLFAVDIGFGKTFLRDPVTSPVSGIGRTYVIQFNATSTSHTIKFTNWGHICQSCTELVLDNVRLYTLAELSASVPHCTLGINDVAFSQSMISISPNPVTNELQVKSNWSELSEIILYDIVSRKLLQQKFVNSVSLNTEQLARGLYLYEVRNKNGLCKKGKVVKD